MPSAGTWLFLQRADVPPVLEQIAEAILAVAAIVAVIGVVGRANVSPAVLVDARPLITKLAGKVRRAGRRDARSRSADLRACRSGPSARITVSVVGSRVPRRAAVAEVWLVPGVLVPTHATLADAFLLKAPDDSSPWRSSSSHTGLGIDEAGSGRRRQRVGFTPPYWRARSRSSGGSASSCSTRAGQLIRYYGRASRPSRALLATTSDR